MSVFSTQENNHFAACSLPVMQPVVMGGLPVVKLVPSVFRDIPYASALLLESGFDASITDHGDFHAACQEGFCGYFEGMFDWNEAGDDVVFVDCFYVWTEVERRVVDNVVRRYDARERFLEQNGGFPSLAFRAGFMLGWLSALALTDRPLAVEGADLLSLLVSTCQVEEASRASGGAVC